MVVKSYVRILLLLSDGGVVEWWTRPFLRAPFDNLTIKQQQ